MTGKLNIRYFAHSWLSDWNHGNAHFLRGLGRSLVQMGHNFRGYEQLGAWSLTNLVHEEGETAIDAIDTFRRQFPELDIRFYYKESLKEFAEQELEGADVVIIHEWNEPAVVNTVLSLKKRFGFRALFHDTHHRAYSSPRDILRFDLHLFDGVLAFGESIRQIYRDAFGVPQVWTFHEAADVHTFKPLEREKEIDLLWIGNWGDEERTCELQEFLVGPAAALPARKIVVHGVRYPEHARRSLEQAGIEFRGYLPNLQAPEAYARARLSLHVPRRQYANGLSGIPTIRVFEALACGIPLLCSPWSDVEGLFRPGEDYLVVSDGHAMTVVIEHLLRDDAARRQLGGRGLSTVLKEHTCEHRARELLEICEELGR
ncbi:MAG: glycosyltransferase [Terriglobales bacterium]